MAQQIPHANEGLVCPLHKKDMSLVCHKCPLWVQLRGKHPNTGQDIDEWNCSLAWLPMLLIENAKEVRQGAAATESFRNEMVTASQITNTILYNAEQARKQLEPPKELLAE